MVAALAQVGVRSRPFTLATTDRGASAGPWPAAAGDETAAGSPSG
jgi:hypothetical protein